MTVLSVVKDVCMMVGVNPPTSLFASSTQPRTQAELLALANEMAQRIAWDTRDWIVLRRVGIVYGSLDGTQTAFDLPPDYRRMLLTTQLRRTSTPRQPMRFIADADEWVMRRMDSTNINTFGEWTLYGTQLHIVPALQPGDTVQFAYLEKDCVINTPTPSKPPTPEQTGELFTHDDDTYRLPERLLKLGMIWQWKANKGTPYAEDLSTYADAITMAMGADKPAPIMIGTGVPAGVGGTVAYPVQ